MLIIANPKYKKYKEEIRLYEKYNPEVYVTKKKGNRERIKNILRENNHEVIVAIGGDGTANLAAQFVVGNDRKLMIVPRGSTNGIFNNLSEKERPFEEKEERKIDVMEIGGNYCLHSAGFGLNAYIIKESRNESFVGFVKYIFAFFRSLFNFKHHYFKVNGKKIETLWLLLANGSNKGVWKILNKEGKFDDGYFEICTIVDQKKYKEARIENLQGSPFHIDGEYMGHPEEIFVKIRQKAIRILV